MNCVGAHRDDRRWRRCPAVLDSGDDRAMTTYSGTKEFEGATFVRASFKGATLRFSDVSGVRMRGVDLDGLDVDSHDLFFGSLIVNGVDVVPYVVAELNRQFPGRELQKSQTVEGCARGGSPCSPRGRRRWRAHLRTWWTPTWKT